MAAIKINNSEEFGKLLDAFAGEIVYAGWHFKLFKALTNVSTEYYREFAQSPTFWGLTLAAHKDAVLVRLYKIYENNDKSLNLQNFLHTISQNLSLFDIAEFRDRLKDNPFVESLAQDSRKPDMTQLKADISFVCDANPSVKKIKIWRNNLVAHRSPELTIGDLNLAKHPLMLEEIEDLINNAGSILNRYTKLFNASIQSSMLIGEDDFMATIKSVRNDIARREKEYVRQLKRVTR
jgi:hypothetical protein